ncbi:MAG: hypothetical protein HYS08_00015 [Chlamydiae bacterium]|nr:hypothetical protein [Chlamydiota bacterium]MBI3266479.1 hypothetical protein [Chlamydiota bacterium]
MNTSNDFGFDEKEWIPDNEGYWNEGQWEKFIEENERLVDKYERVFSEENSIEKYKHPLDLYFKVHFDIDPMNFGSDPAILPIDPNDELEQSLGNTPNEFEMDSEEANEANNKEEEKKLETILCYQSALRFDRSVKAFIKNLNQDIDWQNPSDILVQLSIHAFKTHAHILSGHCFGYEDDVLCANIVKCKWALKEINATARTLDSLGEKYPNFSEEIRNLKGEVQNVKESILSWITALRSRVWWG